ncbi:MAG: cyclase family protein [Thermoleophilia bacterium]|nr:cyclase family protein [Thermoleophilia bacterium]
MTSGSDPRSERVLQTLSLVREGRIYSLARTRFRGMPLFPGHPQLEVLSYRTPHGLRVSGEEPWGPGNDVCLGYMSELIQGTSHTGAHIDALAHMTIGDDDRWLGAAAAEHLGDFGPTKGDASELEPIWARGVLLDVPAFHGVESLPKGYAIVADELEAVARSRGIEIRPGDVALVRTGYMRHWPDRQRMAENAGPGPDVAAARWLLERGIAATGSDTETYEVQPCPDPGSPRNPQPVHTLLLIERGIHIMEGLDLEGLAADGIVEFLFVALPLKIRGGTGSMIDPIAVV